MKRFDYIVFMICLIYINGCAESSFSGGGDKAAAQKPQPTPALQQAAAKVAATPTPVATPVATPEACTEKILFTESIYIDSKVQEYSLIGKGGGTNPSAVPNVRMNQGNIITITAPQGGTMYYTWKNGGPAVPSVCPYGIIATEVRSGVGTSVQDIESDKLGTGTAVKENNTVLYLGYRDQVNYFYDNSGGCSLKVEIKDKKCS